MTDKSIALVTGAAGAIGNSIVDALAKDGHHVIAIDLSQTALDELFNGRDEVDTYVLDITNEAAVDDAFRSLIESYGDVNALVNNAGITGDSAIHKMSFELFRRVMAVNLDGTFLMTRGALRHMRTRDGGGAIVNISSMSARLGNFGQANYAASKAGVIGLTRVAAREGARYAISVNAVLPGFISTPMTDVLSDDVVAARMETIPMARPGQPSEVAEAVRWLCNRGTQYVTGTTIEVAGGRGL